VVRYALGYQGAAACGPVVHTASLYCVVSYSAHSFCRITKETQIKTYRSALTTQTLIIHNSGIWAWVKLANEHLHLLDRRGWCIIAQKRIHVLHRQFPFSYSRTRTANSPGVFALVSSNPSQHRHGEICASAHQKKCTASPSSVTRPRCPDGSTQSGRATKPRADKRTQLWCPPVKMPHHRRAERLRILLPHSGRVVAASFAVSCSGPLRRSRCCRSAARVTRAEAHAPSALTTTVELF
jgi:hypothetical protein